MKQQLAFKRLFGNLCQMFKTPLGQLQINIQSSHGEKEKSQKSENKDAKQCKKMNKPPTGCSTQSSSADEVCSVKELQMYNT